MILNWAYIAGFFDGEGSITYNTVYSGGQGIGRITIAQSGQIGKDLLLEIKGFLNQNGIACSVALNSHKVKHEHWKQGYILYVHTKTGARKFCLWVIPYLRIKKVGCQDFLRFSTIFPRLTGLTTHAKVSTADLVADLRSGLNRKQIAEKHNMKYDTVWSRLHNPTIYTRALGLH